MVYFEECINKMKIEHEEKQVIALINNWYHNSTPLWKIFSIFIWNFWLSFFFSFRSHSHLIQLFIHAAIFYTPTILFTQYSWYSINFHHHDEIKKNCWKWSLIAIFYLCGKRRNKVINFVKICNVYPSIL